MYFTYCNAHFTSENGCNYHLMTINRKPKSNIRGKQSLWEIVSNTIEISLLVLQIENTVKGSTNERYYVFIRVVAGKSFDSEML